MKTCFKCNEAKPLTEFYTHPQMADGHLGKCKECTKRDVSANYRATKPARALYERRRANAAHRREMVMEYQRRMRESSPEKYAARTALGNAVRDGRVQKPSHCQRCGKPSKRIEGHHDDYSKPFDVVWCCFACHRAIHGQEVSAF